MEGLQVLGTDNVVKGLECLLERLWCSQVMAGSKGMARVDAHADPLLVVHEGNDIPQVLPRRAHDVAGPHHVLQHRDDRLGRLVRLVQLRGDARARRSLGVAEGRPRVEVVELDAQLLAPRQVIDEAVVGLRRLGRVGLREIDEIGAVGEGVLAGTVAVFLALADKELLGLGGERWVVPFALGLEEEGE